MDSKKEPKKELEKEMPKKEKEQPKPTRGRVITNKTFTRRVDREAKKNG